MIQDNLIKMTAGREDREIVGNNIPELVEYTLHKIRAKSKSFIKEHLQEDLSNKGYSLIDHHSAMGTYYKVILETQ